MLIVAHRGASGIAPENTMLAFWTALAGGADLIEFDVQITSDRELVIFHDKTSIERVTGDLGGIADFTLEELKTRDFGQWADDVFEGIKIATFQQVLEELPEDQSLIVEVKPQYKDVEKHNYMEKEVVKLLNKYRPKGLGDGYISVRDLETWLWFQEHAPEYTCGLMSKNTNPNDYIQQIKEHKIPMSQIRWQKFSPEDIKKLVKTGTRIMAFYADGPADWDRLIELQVNGIFTNYPSLLRGYLLQKKLK